jgi:CO/xanthine dehydrogenase Mo-binding subunit
VVEADTSVAPYAGVSGGSAVTFTSGLAVLRAAEHARERLLLAASEQLEIAPADLDLADGVVTARGAPARSVTVEELAKKALSSGGGGPIEGHGFASPPSPSPSAATHLVHARVDGETGEVCLLAYAVAQDVGRALNPAIVAGQIRGGVAQGIGWALYEQLAHDEHGQLLTGSFLDYAIPSAERVPEIETLIVEVPAAEGPFGAKGIGEVPVVAVPGAVANAIAAAVGVRMRRLPMTPERVWRALRSNGA